MNAELVQKMGPKIFIQRIVYFAILWSVVLFAIVGFMVSPNVEPQQTQVLWLGFAIVGLSTIALSFFIPDVIERRALQALSVGVEERVADTQDGPSAFARASTVRVFSRPDEALGAAIGASFTPLILRLALRESTAIFGLVTVFLGYPYLYAVPFFVVSFLSVLLAFPRVSRVAGMLETMHGAQLPR